MLHINENTIHTSLVHSVYKRHGFCDTTIITKQNEHRNEWIGLPKVTDWYKHRN